MVKLGLRPTSPLKGLSSEKLGGSKVVLIDRSHLTNQTALVLRFFIKTSLRILRFKFLVVKQHPFFQISDLF